MVLPNEMVTFSINGKSVGEAATNDQGVATLADASLAGIPPGSYAGYVTVSFAGDGNYSAEHRFRGPGGHCAGGDLELDGMG